MKCISTNIAYYNYNIILFDYGIFYTCHVYLYDHGIYLIQRNKYVLKQDALNSIKSDVDKIINNVYEEIAA